MTRHLLVTNDFPPKIGGIQTYLWELWRRLPPDDVVVLTTAHPEAASFDSRQPFRVERIAQRVMLPTPALVSRVKRLAAESGAEFVVLDPAVPAGLIGPRLGLPYVVVMHGSESIGRVPGGNLLTRSVLENARLVVAAGGFPARETERLTPGATPPIAIVPPGIDVDRFAPVSPDERARIRATFGVPADAELVVGVSRLVPRKGFDVAIEACARLRSTRPDLLLAIGGRGREHDRLARLIREADAPARLLGRVDDDALPGLYACADLFVMPCRTRWWGIEPEGFGIVFLEASASGTPPIAGDSGGAADAVVDGVTGTVLSDPTDAAALASTIDRLLADDRRRAAYADEGRRRVLAEFAYDGLASSLASALEGVHR